MYKLAHGRHHGVISVSVSVVADSVTSDNGNSVVDDVSMTTGTLTPSYGSQSTHVEAIINFLLLKT